MQDATDDYSGANWRLDRGVLELVEMSVEFRGVGVRDGRLDDGIHVPEVTGEDASVRQLEGAESEPDSARRGDSLFAESDVGGGPTEVDSNWGCVGGVGGENECLKRNKSGVSILPDQFFHRIHVRNRLSEAFRLKSGEVEKLKLERDVYTRCA
jgi:hypothetical protein